MIQSLQPRVDSSDLTQVSGDGQMWLYGGWLETQMC